jgi:hypothetical protein
MDAECHQEIREPECTADQSTICGAIHVDRMKAEASCSEQSIILLSIMKYRTMPNGDSSSGSRQRDVKRRCRSRPEFRQRSEH